MIPPSFLKKIIGIFKRKDLQTILQKLVEKTFFFIFNISSAFEGFLQTILTYTKDVSVSIKNIAKGTTDPRIEFCLPKLLILVISQGQTQNLIKFHLQNIDQAPTSKSQHQQTSVSRLNLKFKILTKPGFIISTKIQLHYHFKQR